LDLIIDPSFDFSLTKPSRPADLKGRNLPVRGEPVKRPLVDFQVGSQLVECEDRLLARCHITPTTSAFVQPQSMIFSRPCNILRLTCRKSRVNIQRPHDSLNDMTPFEYRNAA